MRFIVLKAILLFALITSCNSEVDHIVTELNPDDQLFQNLDSSNGVKLWCDSLSVISDTFIPSCAKKNWVFVEDERKMLYGGLNPDSHFDISNWALDECNLGHGLGREFFQALIRPEYYSIEEAQEDTRNVSSTQDDARYIIVLSNDRNHKAYSIELLTKHEVINEIVDGDPIAIAYCFLAELGAVYSRVYYDKTFTFALSGFTYRDPNVWNGIHGFVFWDRETESLWWPLIDKAVSGIMMGTDIKKYNTEKWFETTWGEIKSLYPNTLIMKPGQSMEIPTNLPTYSCADLLD